ncbi:hypothetical protein, partial [Shigella sonnei]
ADADRVITALQQLAGQ